MQTDRITWCNGFHLNGNPVPMYEIRSIFDERTSSKKWAFYEQRKAELRDQFLTPKAFELACRRLADELGI